MTLFLSGPEKRGKKAPLERSQLLLGRERVGAALDHNISANPDNQLGQNESDRTQSPQWAKAKIHRLTLAFFLLVYTCLKANVSQDQ